jgi:maleate isomerase
MKKIGVLIPTTNLTVEYEIQELFDRGALNLSEICFYIFRIPYNTSYKSDKKQFLGEIARNSVSVLQEALNMRMDSCAFFCTSSAILNKEVVLNGNPAESIVAAAKHLNIKKCLLITPYDTEVGGKIKTNLVNNGIEVISQIDLNLLDTHDYFKFGISGLEAAIVKNYKKGCGDIIISCTNLPTLHLIESIEKKLSTRIISSNSSMFWKIINESDVKIKNSKFLGSLFSRVANDK